MYTFFWLIVATLTAMPTLVGAQETIPDFLVRFSGFLRDILLPLLFSVAFLFFIYNMAKYFIFSGEESGSREEGKRNAIYGIAAFVFLISIWTIVNMFTSGLGIERTGVICADYFRIFGGGCSTLTPGSIPSTSIGGGTGGGGGSTGSGGTGSGGTGGGTGGGGTGGTGGGTGGGSTGGGGTGGGTGGGSTGGGGSTPAAPLAELIFGTGRDGAGYHRSLVTSGALATTPAIATTTSCFAGFETLQLAARAESTQAAYLFFQTTTGQRQWRNITDRTMANYIGYDRDIIDAVIQGGGQNLVIVHLHQDSRPDGLGLTTTSLGPSAADMRAMCTLNNPAIRYVTVDESGLWLMRHDATTCPYSPAANVALPSIETYLTLAGLEPSTRTTELERYLASSLVPVPQRTAFTSLANADLGSESFESILARSQGLQTLASTTISRRTPNSLCTTLLPI